MAVELSAGGVFGPFRLESRLGGGTFGAVWKAVDTRNRETVALKVLLGTYSAAEEARLRADVELLAAAAGAKSSHVVRVLSGGVKPAPHVVMEYLAGTDLATKLSADGVIGQAETISVAEAVADALTRDSALWSGIRPNRSRSRPGERSGA